jgi:16S rRNA processing protein RimM
MNNEVAVGRFGSPYGVKGWIKVVSFTDPIEQILSYQPWFIIKDHNRLSLERIKGKVHGGHLVVQLPDCLDRDIAKTYTNIDIFVARNKLPQLSTDEFYWVDLIGLTVFNQQLINLGTVDNLLATGSNDVLIVVDAEGKERYIPYLDNVVLKVDLVEKTILVDWGADF